MRGIYTNLYIVIRFSCYNRVYPYTLSGGKKTNHIAASIIRRRQRIVLSSPKSVIGDPLIMDFRQSLSRGMTGQVKLYNSAVNKSAGEL